MTTKRTYPSQSNEYKRAYYLANRERIQAQRKIYKAENRQRLNAYERAHYAANREVKLAQQKKYREGNSEKLAAYGRQFRIANKDKVALWSKQKHLRRSYGLSYNEYSALWDAQGGCCALCGAHEDTLTKPPLHVDHDHQTGMIRGLLCHPCNLGIGLLGDDLDGVLCAVKYLRGVIAKVIS